MVCSYQSLPHCCHHGIVTLATLPFNGHTVIVMHCHCLTSHCQHCLHILVIHLHLHHLLNAGISCSK